MIPWWKIFHQAMTQLNMKPWELGQYTIPQLMCLMSDVPQEKERIVSPAQYMAVLKREEQAEKEWLGK